MGFLDFLSPALTTGTMAAGAYQGAQAHEHDRERTDQLTMLQMLRQKQLDDSQKSLHESQIRENDARAHSYMQTPLTYKTGPNGELIVVPSKTDAGATVSPTDTGTKVHVNQGAPVAVDNPDNPTSATKNLATPGGQPFMVNGAPATRTARPPRTGSATDMNTVHASSAVSRQLTQAEHEVAAAQKAAATVGDQVQSALLTPDERARQQALAQRLPALTYTRDSLKTVYSKLAQRQQTTATGAPVTAPPSKPAGAAPLGPAQRADSTKAAANLRAILASPAPDSVKSHARQLFRQHIQELRSTPPDE